MTEPFEDIRNLIAGLPPLPQAPAAAGLVGLATWLKAHGAGVVRRPILALYAGSPGPGQLAQSEDKRARLEAVAAGDAPASRMAAAMGAGLEAFDLAIDRPIGDVASGAALNARECTATMAFGMEVLAKQPDLLMIGHIGSCAFDEGLFGPGDPLERLRGYAGREVAACVGAILAARSLTVPVILGGEAACAAAVVLEAVEAGLSAHCRLAAPVGFRLTARLPSPPILGEAEEDGAIAALAAAAVVRAAAGLQAMEH